MQYGLSNCLLDMQFIKLKMHVHKLKFFMMLDAFSQGNAEE